MRRSSTSRTTCRRTMSSPARSSSSAACSYFPSGTIFLVVVDPGVGSSRRGIAAEAGDFRFVAPDNGVLTAVLDEHAPKRIVELTERKYARPTVSRTFEGRDRFAPAAAWLAQRHRPDRAGPPGGRDASPGDSAAARRAPIASKARWCASIASATSSRTSSGRRSRRWRPAPLDISVGRHPVPRVVSTYADAPPGEVCALFGSTDHLEIAASGASAAAALDLAPRRGRARRPPRVIRFAVSTAVV